jgi:hypothetical protein
VPGSGPCTKTQSQDACQFNSDFCAWFWALRRDTESGYTSHQIRSDQIRSGDTRSWARQRQDQGRRVRLHCVTSHKPHAGYVCADLVYRCHGVQALQLSHHTTSHLSITQLCTSHLTSHLSITQLCTSHLTSHLSITPRPPITPSHLSITPRPPRQSISRRGRSCLRAKSMPDWNCLQAGKYGCHREPASPLDDNVGWNCVYSSLPCTPLKGLNLAVWVAAEQLSKANPHSKPVAELQKQ